MNYQDDFDEGLISALLTSYQDLKNNGYTSHFLELEDYEILANYFLRINDINKALEVCETGYIYHNHTTELLEMQSEILYDSKKYNQALDLIDKIQDMLQGILPFNTLILKANILVDQERIQDAIALLNQEINKYMPSDQCYILHEIVDIFDEAIEYQSVYDTLVRILEIDPLNDEALFKFAYWTELADRLEEGEALQRQLLASYPMHSILWYNLGSILQTRKQYDEAIEAYQYAIDLDDKLESAYRNLADIYMKKRNYNMAIDVLQDYLSIGRAEDVVFEALGDCYSKKKNYDIARSFFLEATQLNPNDDLLHYKLGQTYTKEEKHLQALAAFENAYKLNPQGHEYPLAIAQTMVQLQQYEYAFIYFQKALELKSNYKPAWIGLIELLYDTEEYVAAMDELMSAMIMTSNTPELFMLDVAINLKLGKVKEAQLCLQFSLEEGMLKTKYLLNLVPDILQRKDMARIINDDKRNK